MATWDLSSDLPKIGHPMPNAGSLCYLYVVRLRDVDSVPDPAPGAVTGTPIQTVTGASIATYRFDPDTVRLRDQQRNSGQGPYFELILEGFRSGIDNAHRHEITKLAPGYYICVWRNVDGQIRQLGSLERPMRFSASLDSGASDQDEVGADWQFTGIQVGDPVFMDPESPIPNIINNPCDAITSANFTVTWNIDGDRKLTSISIVADSGISSMSYPLSVGVTPADGGRTWIYIRTGTNTYTPWGSGPNYVNVPGTYTLNALLSYTLTGGTQCGKTLHFPFVNTDTGQSPTVSLGAVDSNGVRVDDGDSRQTPLRLTFFAGATDPDGDVVEYRWDFDGDGTIDQVTATPSISHSYTTGGNQTPTVTVVDNSGNETSDSFSFTAVANQAPSASNVQVSPMSPATSLLAGATAQVAWDYLDNEANPQSGTVVRLYRYDDSSATTGEALIAQATVSGATFLHNFSLPTAATDYYVRAQVTPNDGNTAGITALSSIVIVESVKPEVANVRFSSTPPQVGVSNSVLGDYSHPASLAEGNSVVKIFRYDAPSGTSGETLLFTGSPGEAYTFLTTAPNLRYVEASYIPVDANGVVGTEVRSARVLLEPTDITGVNDIAASLWEYWEADNVILDGSGNVETLTGKKGVLNLTQVTPSRRATVAPANTPNGNDAIQFVWGANMAYSSALSGTNFPTNGVIAVFAQADVSSGTYPSFFATTNGGDTINTGLFIFHEGNAYRFRYGTPTNSHTTGSRVLPQPYRVMSLAYGTSVFRSWLDTSEVGSNLSLAVTPDYSNIIVGGPTVGTGFPNGSLDGKIAGVYVFSGLDLYRMRQLQKFLTQNG